MMSSINHSCSNCLHEFKQNSAELTFWDLQCSHCLCAECFTSFTLNIKKKCPQCQKIPSSIIHTFYKTHGRGSNHKLVKITKTISLIHEEKEDYLTLHTQNNPSITVCIIPGQDDDQEIRDAMGLIFRKLKGMLNPHRSLKEKRKSYDLDSIHGKNYFEKLDSIRKKDVSLLLLCLKSLALGGTIIQGGSRKSTISCQLFAAAENIRCALDPKGSLFRRLISNALTVLGKETQNILLRKVGLCYSRQTEDRNNTARTCDAKKNSVLGTLHELSRHSYAILLFDNLGFKNRQGYRKGLGYEQFTVPKIFIIHEEELKKHNIYNSNNEEQLSRCRQYWKDMRKEAEGSFENIMQPNESDCNLFAGVVLDITKSIIKAESKGTFPSLQDCKELLRTEAFKNGIVSPKVWDGRVYYGQQANSNSSGTKERVIYDVPMYKDLNKTSTVLEIMRYLLDINSYILKNGKEGDEFFKDFKPILEEARIAMGGDGSPIISAQNLMRKMENLHEKIIASLGGFHLMLELYKKRGSLFEHTHLRNLFAMTRVSTQAQDFVLQPSDPNQVEAESIKIHTAIYLCALRKLLFIKRNNLDIDDLFDKDFEDVIDDSDDETFYDEGEDGDESSEDDRAYYDEDEENENENDEDANEQGNFLS